MRKGKIFTFYSYKGGTGRTMAIVNMAALLATPNETNSKTSMKTLVIDWDLEAPGLHRYMKPYSKRFLEKGDLERHPGLIDLFIDIKKKMDGYDCAILSTVQCEEALRTVPLDDYIIQSDINGLYYLKAGNFTDGYAKKITEFGWEELFRRSPGIYKVFANQLSSQYDFILIDSRTGLTDTSGICTMILPEKLILVFTPNSQSLEGVVDVGRRAARYRLSSKDTRPLKLYPLPTRIEMAEKELREQWRRGSSVKGITGYQVVFESLFEEVYRLKNIDFTAYFDEIQIQHEPRFSYGEEIAVLDKNQPDRLSMADSYDKFLSRILSDDMIWGYKKLLNNHNMPNRIPPIGREKELDELMKGIQSRFPILSIHGPAGVGKTILALEIGHRCLNRSLSSESTNICFDFIIWISSKNKLDKRRNLNDVLNTIAGVIGFSSITQMPVNTPSGKLAKEAAIANLLTSHKVLIIINNLELHQYDSELLDWFKNIPEPSKILFTTRVEHHDIPSWKLRLSGLNPKEQEDLISRQMAQSGLNQQQLVVNKDVNELFELSNGNPKMLEFLIGMIKTNNLGSVVLKNDMRNAMKDNDPEKVFNVLHGEIWKCLSDDAKCVLKTIPLFVGIMFIKQGPLRTVSNLKERAFNTALEQLLDLNLIKSNPEECYFVHPITREFGRTMLQQDTAFEKNARERWANYYKAFVEETITRKEPNEAYWNVLVSDKMLDLDAEWTSIFEVMKWAYEKRPDILFEFTLLVVHYMDSRFYNQERLMFVKKAIETVTNDKGYAYEKALLQIDALGWTYVEENQPEKATRSIDDGLKIITGTKAFPVDKIDDLNALANAWKARSAAEADTDFRKVEVFIKKAFEYKGVKPWIKFRINMAGGDICIKKNDVKRAAAYYEAARDFLNEYGGEGHNYQINPRIGIAYLKMGRLKEAEETFRELQKLETIPIGQLYGQYGLALVNLVKGDIDGARRSLRNVKEEINRHTASNLLQSLIEHTEVDIIKNLTQYQLANSVMV